MTVIDPVRTSGQVAVPQLRSMTIPVLALFAGHGVIHDAHRAAARARDLLPTCGPTWKKFPAAQATVSSPAIFRISTSETTAKVTRASNAVFHVDN
jgi:hypothetical protein